MYNLALYLQLDEVAACVKIIVSYNQRKQQKIQMHFTG